ncbi:MAG: tyrosine-protein phosphatase [Paracoccaceae bacterium]
MTEISVRREPLLPTRPNLRELGGLPAGGGRTVRAGRFFRGPALHGLTAEEAAALEPIGLAHVVDFRGRDEAAARPATLPGRRLHLSIEPTAAVRLMDVLSKPDPAPEAISAAMQETYRDFVRVNAETFARFLGLLAEADGAPFLFHCTAGKDRTGFAAALILHALGADAETIEADYLATNGLWRPDPNLAAMVPELAHAALFRVSADYLEAAFEELDRLHGGPLAFADKAMGGERRRRVWAESQLE